jgi:hypothetical protein
MNFCSLIYLLGMCNSISVRTDNACTVARSGKAIHQLNDEPAETPSRSAKRRRTENLPSEGATSLRDAPLVPVLEGATISRNVVEKQNVVPGDLQAHTLADTGAGASSVHGNGAALLPKRHAFPRTAYLLWLSKQANNEQYLATC